VLTRPLTWADSALRGALACARERALASVWACHRTIWAQYYPDGPGSPPNRVCLRMVAGIQFLMIDEGERLTEATTVPIQEHDALIITDPGSGAEGHRP